ncbi:MAG: bifunctional hydroxymethylpyrimidine kinase/phosphomethylpyrimidine kinase [bacterium]
MRYPALTIAGSDPSGGAGLQADLKTFHQHGVFGMSVVTLVTAQNTRGLTAIDFLSADLVRAQLDAVLSDIPPAAAKTGAIGRVALIEAVAERLRAKPFPLVVDPVMISKHGHALLEDDAVRTFIDRLLPLADIVTPNLHEAARLIGRRVDRAEDMEPAARLIESMGPRHVLVKGGHLVEGAGDLLLSDGVVRMFPSERLASMSTHGTGCTLAAAIAARLARGESVVDAVDGARRYVREAIAHAPGLGQGCGPIDHFARVP